MRKFKIIAFLACLIAGYGIGSPQTTPAAVKTDSRSADARISKLMNNSHQMSMGSEVNKDSVEALLSMFYYDQFRHFQDPRAPYFMFLSKNSDLAFGVGGQVKVKGYFDWNGSIPSSNFNPYDIPIPKNPTKMRNLAASASGTGLFFTLLGSNRRLGNYMAYFQADFGGYNGRGFRIKKAYLTVKDWTAGYTTTTFEDTKAEPSTVDGAGPNGINSRKNILVRYMHTFRKKWTVAGSVEFPKQSVSADRVTTAECNAYVPDIAFFGQYQWNRGNSHLRLSGLLRTLTYRDLLTMRNYNVTGWGLQLSTVINPVAPLTFFGIVSTGAGHASYTTDLGNGDFDLIADEDRPGRLYAPLAAGFVVGAQYYITDRVFANVAFSEQTYYPKKNPHDSQYRYGLYGVANIFWEITGRFEVGFEYLHGKRQNFDGVSGSADRFMAQMMLSF